MKLHTLSLVTIMLVACSSAPTPVALCELVDRPPNLNGRIVSTEGYLLISHHGSALMDPTCGRGIPIEWWSDEGKLQPLADIMARYRREQVMEVKLRVVGKMEAKRDDAGPSGRLTLSEADVLTAESLAEDDKDRFISWLDVPSSSPFRRSH